MKRLASLLFLAILFNGCAKIKFQKRLYEDFEDFTKTLKGFPEELQVNMGKNITQLEGAGINLIDKAKSAGNEFSTNFGKTIGNEVQIALKSAKVELADLIVLADEIATAKIKQGDKMAKDRLVQVDKMGNNFLNKTDTLIQNAILQGDTTIQKTINKLDIAIENKMILADDLAQKNVKAFMAHLDTFAVEKIALVEKVIERRINQIFYKLNNSIQTASSELDKILGKNIHRTFFMGNVVAKNLLEAAQKSTTILIILSIEGVIIILVVYFFFALIMGILKSKITLNIKSIVASSIFLILGTIVLLTDATEIMIGEKYINTDDVFASTEKNFKKVEKIFNSSNLIDTWEVINTCTETIQGLEMCKVLSAPDNPNIQAYYDDRIDDVNWLLSKSLPKKYLNRK
jgi:hypothetical protein